MTRLKAVAAATIALFAAAAAPAAACDNPASTPVFSPWYDYANYFLAPDGGFEAGAAGWDTGGADVVAGNNSHNTSGAGSSALALNGNDVATSPKVCVDLDHPTFRFFVRRTGGSSLSTLRVQVLLPGGSPITVGYVGGSGSWQPSPILLIGTNLLFDEASFRFAPVSGSWEIDDVYVDPRGSR